MIETIALLSCNIGGVDNIRLLPSQNIVSNLHYYTERNLPFPLPNLNNRLKGKYIKIQSHRFLNYDYMAWVDGSIEVISQSYLQKQYELLGNADVLVCVHPSRPSVGTELKFILDQIALNGSSPHSNYLINRYANEPIQEELDYLISKGAQDLPLYAGGIFTRRNSEKVNKAFDEWFLLCLEFANFDQCMFSYIIHKHGLKVATQDYHSDLRKFHNHLF